MQYIVHLSDIPLIYMVMITCLFSYTLFSEAPVIFGSKILQLFALQLFF